MPTPQSPAPSRALLPRRTSRPHDARPVPAPMCGRTSRRSGLKPLRPPGQCPVQNALFDSNAPPSRIHLSPSFRRLHTRRTAFGEFDADGPLDAVDVLTALRVLFATLLTHIVHRTARGQSGRHTPDGPLRYSGIASVAMAKPNAAVEQIQLRILDPVEEMTACDRLDRVGTLYGSTAGTLEAGRRRSRACEMSDEHSQWPRLV